MTMMKFLVDLFHSIPHLNFKFNWVNTPFDLKIDSEYVESLGVLAILCGAIAVLFLFTIIITWICQCCSREDNQVKSRRKVRRLSTVLFIISVFCFFFLGFCLFGNDLVNRGVTTSIVSLKDVHHNFVMADSTRGTLYELCKNATDHIKTLEDVVHDKSAEANKTDIAKIDSLITQLSDSVDSVMMSIGSLKEALNDTAYLEKAFTYGERIELERWMVLVCLPSIMLCVLFAGVIAFCRQSKKGAIMFSGLGIAIFILVWLMAAFVLPATVALADFCTEGGTFLKSEIKERMLRTLGFYSECTPHLTHDFVPPNLGVNNISERLSEMQLVKIQLDLLLDTTFNHSEVITNATDQLTNDGSKSLKAIGALESNLACYAYKDDLTNMIYGVCNQAVIGSSILTFCLLLLGLFMFTLLLIVSKSWNLFTRLGSDYVEVDEDDPFFPRNNDSNIPVDIYGTHVFNPRTRERTEPSTGTTTATANGQASESDPLWSRTVQNASAPTATIGRPPYDEHHYSNYRDQYDV